MRDRRRRFGDGFAEYEADRKSTRLNSSHLVISYAVSFFRKNTRLNSSHLVISYAVFCLKKKTGKSVENEEGNPAFLLLHIAPRPERVHVLPAQLLADPID